MPRDIHEHRLLILDFGAQYTQLIARRVREAGVYCEIHDPSLSRGEFMAFGPKGVILSGGPKSAYAEDAPRAPAFILEAGLPVLGICYGMQTMALQLGGRVEQSATAEFGYAQLRTASDNVLLSDLEHSIPAEDGFLHDVWMSHSDEVTQLPPGFVVIAATENVPIAAMADESRRMYGVQFHPEVTHTKAGQQILKRFAREVCGCECLWTPAAIVEDAVQTARRRIKRDKVLLGLSGGVDSAVTAALLHQAIGDQLTCVFVDNGLLRLNEGDQVMETFARSMGVRVLRVDAEEVFLERLAGIHDPEAKRKVIGNAFIEIFEQQAGKLGGIQWLAQGTIYPDVIESAGAGHGKAHVIKSHHNVGGLPEKLNLKLIEPLRELFKDEVRQVGLELELPRDMVYRHPFPGPGLGVRVVGEVTKAHCEILRRADAIFIEELRKADWYDKVSQAFAVFLPVKSVGVVGDGRRYSYVLAIRAVETTDYMTARWAHLPYELLETVSNRIINEIPEASRVSYDISSKPPATIEWE